MEPAASARVARYPSTGRQNGRAGYRETCGLLAEGRPAAVEAPRQNTSGRSDSALASKLSVNGGLERIHHCPLRKGRCCAIRRQNKNARRRHHHCSSAVRSSRAGLARSKTVKELNSGARNNFAAPSYKNATAPSTVGEEPSTTGHHRSAVRSSRNAGFAMPPGCCSTTAMADRTGCRLSCGWARMAWAASLPSNAPQAGLRPG